MEFSWEPWKAFRNIRVHLVSFDEALTVFFDPNATTDSDEEHSEPGDERLVTIGRSQNGRLLFVVHNEEDEAVHIISARVASPTQRKYYEEA